jgi:hypothetical protein
MSDKLCERVRELRKLCGKANSIIVRLDAKRDDLLLQARLRDQAMDTILCLPDVSGCNDHLVLVLLSFEHVPVRQAKDIGHGDTLSKTGFRCVSRNTK